MGDSLRYSRAPAPGRELRLFACTLAGLCTAEIIGDAAGQGLGAFGPPLVRIAGGMAAAVLVWVVWTAVAGQRGARAEPAAMDPPKAAGH